MKEYNYKDLRIIWTGHAGFRVEGEVKAYFDPYKVRHPQEAELIFISHEHFDHYSEEDIGRIAGQDTYIVGAMELMNKVISLPGEKVFIKPWNEYFNEKYGVHVLAVPAYNINKFRSPGVPFHPKEDEKVGFVVTMGDVKIYHAGDTDFIPDMNRLKDLEIDVALLPVSGKYVMTPEEAAEAAKAIMPKVVIPMHWGAIVAGRGEAERFKRLVEDSGIEVVIMEPE